MLTESLLFSCALGRLQHSLSERTLTASLGGNFSTVAYKTNTKIAKNNKHEVLNRTVS